MLQTTTGSCTRKYAQAQNAQQRWHKPATTQAQNPQHLRAQRQKRAKRATSKTRNRKNAQQKLQACNGKTRASV
jgi:hypothetical protein